MRDGPQMVAKGRFCVPGKMPRDATYYCGLAKPRTLAHPRQQSPWKTYALDPRGTCYRATIQTNKKPLETTVKLITY